MLFLTYWFVVFLGVTLPAYWLIPAPRFRLALLLVYCLVFHAHFAGSAGMAPILVLGVVTYLAALTRKRAACLTAIGLCVAALVFYKYTSFLCLEVLGAIWSHAGHGALKHLQPLLPAAPPLAISFFVFEFVHYLCEVQRGGPPVRSPFRFCLFALFWPSIVAGPVKRYEQFLPALRRAVRTVGSQDVAAGILQVALGLMKKVLADNLTAYVAYHLPRFLSLPLTVRWLVFAAISLRILLDFSGYSDMAIGLARMLGVRLPANFHWPYLAANLTEFWRRWHISLSTWIRDYVYIPLGGGRRGLVRKVANGLLAFGLCGLWHGAAWHFVVWGVYHGVGLAICSGYRSATGRAGEILAGWFQRNRIAAHALTLMFVCVGWLLFFYPIPVAWSILKLLFVVT